MTDALRQQEFSTEAVVIPRSRTRNLAINGVLGLLLLALILAPRLADLDALVTPDEPLWVARSANFYEALSSGHLTDTYQFVHPGVPVMWLGTIAYMITRPDLPELTGGQVETRGSALRNIFAANGERMIDVLVDLRIAVTIASALVLICLFYCLIPLVGRWSAVAAIAFLAVDPMHIGYTRLLHLDGLSTNLLLLSVVAFCGYLQRSSRSMLVVSAIAAGIAGLTRSANGVLVPLVGLLVAVDIGLVWWRGRQLPRALIRRQALMLVVWGGIAALVFVLLWPAMWVSPIGTLREMWSGGLDLASDPHTRQMVFRGKAMIADPGWLYYPIVLIYRISPIALVGLVLAGFVAIVDRDGRAGLPRRLCFDLVLFAGAYLVILSFAAKKLDRYILPSIAALDLVAIFGWIAFFSWLIGKFTLPDPRVARYLLPVCLVMVLLGQSALAADTRPYYLNEASPLLGGPEQASKEFSFSWGEGGKRVAEALQQLPDIEDKVVVVGPWPMAVDYYLPFEVKKAIYQPLGEQAALWLGADYIVVSEPEIARRFYSPAFLAWFDAQTPVSTVVDQGRVYARIYEVSGDPLPPPFYGPDSSVTRWGNQIDLVGSDLPLQVRQGRNLRIHLFFQHEGAAEAIMVDTEVIAPDGSVVATSSTNIDIAGGLSPQEVVYSVELPPALPLGNYHARITLRSGETGTPLTGSYVVSGATVVPPLDLGSFEVIYLPE